MRTRQKTGETGFLSASVRHDGSQVRRHQTPTRSVEFCAFILKKKKVSNSTVKRLMVMRRFAEAAHWLMRQQLQSNKPRSIDRVSGGI